MRANQRWLIAGALAAASLTTLAPAASGQPTYYIGRSNRYSEGDCAPGASHTADDTSQLVSRLNGAGWTGLHRRNAENRATSYVENCLSGIGRDHDWDGADTKTLVAFSGHGHVGTLAFTHRDVGMCAAKLGWSQPFNFAEGTTRLGSMSGAQAGYAIWSASCVLNMTNPSNLANNANWQWLQQQLGFHDSPGLGTNSLSGWWDNLNTRNNAAAWLEKLQWSPFGYRTFSPVAVSYGPTEHWCWAVQANANLRNGTYRYPRGGGPACGADWQPEFWYCWEMRNRQDCECDDC